MFLLKTFQSMLYAMKIFKGWKVQKKPNVKSEYEDSDKSFT